MSRRLETKIRTVADDVVREVLDRLRLGTASGNSKLRVRFKCEFPVSGSDRHIRLLGRWYV